MSFYSRAKLAANSFQNAISPKNYGGFISSPSVCTGKNSTSYRPFSFLHSASKSNPGLFQSSGTQQGKQVTKFGKPQKESDQKLLSKPSKWLIASTILVSFYYMNFETVPFTKRSRFVFFPSILERELGKIQMEHQIQQSWVVLPKTDPHSIRAGLIFDELIKGLKMAVEEEKDNDIRRHNLKSTTKHLEKLKWEIVVVDDTSVLLTPLPGGKILINTTFFRNIKSDAGIAALIAQEVAGVVARHYAEEVTATMRHNIIMSISIFPYLFFSYVIPKPEVVNRVGHILRKLRMYQVNNAIEADQIAVMLIAWAGYDPQIAVEVYWSHGDFLRHSHTNYPSGKDRAGSLVRSARMEKAVAIYKKKQATGSSGEGKASEAKTETI